MLARGIVRTLIDCEVRMRHAPLWECERSVEVDVPVAFAWAHMTDIRNWNDPPAEFTLDGPFVDGSRGSTQMPGRPVIAKEVG